MSTSPSAPPPFSANNELNRRLVESFPGGMVQVALDGSIVQANELAQEILGLSYSELTHRYVADFKAETIWEDGSPCDPDDYPVSRCLKTGQPQAAVTIGVRRPDGRFSWGQYSAIPVLDPATREQAGAIVRIVDITNHKASEVRLRELKQELERRVEERTVQLQAANEALMKQITERIEIENQLRESKRIAEGLAEAAPYVMYVYDVQQRRTLFTNRQAATTLGYTPAEMESIAQGIEATILHPESLARFEEHLQRLAQAKDHEVVEFEYRAQRADGQWRWLRGRDVVLSRTPDGQVREVVGIAEDISDFKRAVEAQQESSSELRFITEHAPDFILQIDRAGTILFINRSIAPLTTESVVGTNIRVWIPERDYDAYSKMVSLVFETGSSERFETTSMGHDASQRWYSCHVGPVVVDGSIRSAVVVARDITDRKLAEERLKAKQQLLKSLLSLQERERKLIAAEIHDGMVQDVTGAKMVLEGAKHLLQAKYGPIESLDRVEELLGRAIAEGRRMIGDLRPLEVDEKGIVEMIRFLVAEETRRSDRQIAFTHHVHFDRLHPLLEGTVFRVAQEALTNIRRHSRAERAELRLEQRGEWVVLEIIDNGVGFDPDSVPEDRYGIRGIFQRARIFGGTAAIDSAPGKGARIRVEFPINLTLADEKLE